MALNFGAFPHAKKLPGYRALTTDEKTPVSELQAAIPVIVTESQEKVMGHGSAIGRMMTLPGLAAILIALATVSYQAVRAALANPMESMRSE